LRCQRRYIQNDVEPRPKGVAMKIIEKTKSVTMSGFYIFRETALAVGLLIIFWFVPLFGVGSPNVRAFEYGPIWFILLWCLPWSLFFAIRHHSIASLFFSHRMPPADQFPVQLQLFFRAGPYLVLALIIFPFVSDTGREALDPMSYWKAKATAKNDCAFSNTVLQNQRENVIVAANKLNMGIGTTQELRDAKKSLDFMAEAFDGCDVRYAKNIELAQSRVTELILAANDISTLAQKGWGTYDPVAYEYRIENGEIQRLKR
jgi:hypothetical protein